jgi:predicted Kef-type K+ transport protein
MDPAWIAGAFLFGFAISRVGLPPLIGFLIAGFVLGAFGVEGGAVLEEIADLGVLLLLFTIGLKLRIRDLFRPETWAGASIHMLAMVGLFSAGIVGLSAVGVSSFAGLEVQQALLIAFALSFSSTVFAVKVLEEKGEAGSLHGRVAIGILIMQDVIAVVFLTASTGKLPSPWALAYVAALLLARPLLIRLLARSGHGQSGRRIGGGKRRRDRRRSPGRTGDRHRGCACER